MPTRPFSELESQPFFRRALWKRSGYLLLALVLDLLVLAFVAALHVSTRERDNSIELLGYHVYLAYNEWHSYFWMVAILVAQFVLGNWAFRRMLETRGMISLYPTDKSDGRTFAGLTAEQLVRMVFELAEEMGVGPIKRIVVSDRPDPNAYTANILGLGNIVVLHTNLMEILSPEGIRAIVAHEVAHIRRRDSLMYLMLGFPRLFINLLGIFLMIKIGAGLFSTDSWWQLVQRLSFLALTWSVAMFVLTRLARITNLAAQQSEYLADASAAWAVGVEPTLNALLLVGERAEALTVLQQELAKQPHLKGAGLDEEQLLGILRRFPPRELSKDKAKWLASRLYIESRLAELKETLCVPFSDEDIIALAKQADGALKKRQETESPLSPQEQHDLEKASHDKEQEQEKLLLDWRKYDANRSGHLDMQEAAILVRELRENPKKMIFRQFLENDAEWQSHPTMRARILFLYDAFQPAAQKG